MSIYSYIASRNPQGAIDVIRQFGYRIQDPKHMGKNLEQLVAQEGKPALMAILKLHPDREVIMETINEDKQSKLQADGGTNDKCSCKGCKSGSIEQFLGADGILSAAGYLSSNKTDPNAVTNDSNKLAATNNALIIAGALLIAVLIYKVK